MRKLGIAVWGIGLLSGCVIWKNAGNAESPQTLADITAVAEKIVFDSSLVPESSGVENLFGDSRYFITHGDSFTPSILYGIQIGDNSVLRYDQFRVKGAVQFDWEDMAVSVEEGEPVLYLGDIGDNWRFRTWKSIYVIRKIEDGQAFVDRRIRFRCIKNGKTVYADTEALFSFGDSLYIMTKNYGESLVFRIPANGKNRVEAEYVFSLFIPSLVTSAAVNSSQTRLAVLSLNYLYLYDISGGLDHPEPVFVYSTAGCRQCEGVCFTSDGKIAVTNEQGDLYLFSPSL